MNGKKHFFDALRNLRRPHTRQRLAFHQRLPQIPPQLLFRLLALIIAAIIAARLEGDTALSLLNAILQ